MWLSTGLIGSFLIPVINPLPGSGSVLGFASFFFSRCLVFPSFWSCSLWGRSGFSFRVFHRISYALFFSVSVPHESFFLARVFTAVLKGTVPLTVFFSILHIFLLDLGDLAPKWSLAAWPVNSSPKPRLSLDLFPRLRFLPGVSIHRGGGLMVLVGPILGSGLTSLTIFLLFGSLGSVLLP